MQWGREDAADRVEPHLGAVKTQQALDRQDLVLNTAQVASTRPDNIQSEA